MHLVGLMVVGRNESKRYLKKSLKELSRLCDDAVIVGNNTTPEDEKMIKSFGFWFYRDDREWGKEQPNIKTDLLKRVGKLKPDWVVAIDADEAFPPEFTREEAERLANTGEYAYYFLVVNLYNDTEHFAHSVGIQRFWNIRYFKFMPEHGLQYQRKSLHCGLAPPICYKYGWHAPYYLEHYGLMKKEDRLRKAERYKKYDPTFKFKDRVYYDELVEELPMLKFDRQQLLKKLAESTETQPRKIPKL